MNAHFNAGVGIGDFNQDGSGDTWTGSGGDGTGSIMIVIKPGNKSGPAAGTLNYVGTPCVAGLTIPFTGSFCGARPCLSIFRAQHLGTGESQSYPGRWPPARRHLYFCPL